MIRMKQKLASRTGASLILALVAMAICLIVGASILMSASAAVDSAKTKKDEEAARLAVSSAAALMKDKVEKTGLDIKKSAHDGSCDCTINTTYTPGEDAFQKAIQAATYAALTGTDADFGFVNTPYTGSSTSFTVLYGTNQKDTVSCTFTVYRKVYESEEVKRNDYSAELTLSSKDGLYATTLHFTGTLSALGTSLDESTVCAHGNHLLEKNWSFRWSGSNVT